MLEEIKRNCIVQSSPRIAHPSTPAPHYSQIMPLYYFYNIWIFLPLPPRCKPIYMNCSNTTLHPYRITDLFSTGIAFVHFTLIALSCQVHVKSIHRQGDWQCPHVLFIFIFSSPEQKLRMSYCHHPMSVVRRRPSSTISLLTL